MARTRWPPGPGNPGLFPGQADQAGSAGGCHKNLGPADRSILKTARAASADSEVRPGPRPPTLRPRQVKAREAGPEALPTPSLPTMYWRIIGRRDRQWRTDKTIRSPPAPAAAAASP